MQDASPLALYRSAARRWAGRGVLALCLMLVCLPVLAATRTVVADHTLSGWSMDDGLPHNLVHAIAQDKEGFIWAATWEGAARFNGRTFTVFDRENTPDSEFSGMFNFVVEDDGSMLAGTGDGVYQYRNGRWRALAPGLLSGMRVNSMLRDRDGSLWISSAAKLHRLVDGQRLETVSDLEGFPDTFVTRLAQAEPGVLIVGTEKGLYRLADGRMQPWGLERTTIRGITPDHKGGWYVASDTGLWHVDADGTASSVQPGRPMDAVVLDGTGVLWSSMRSGTVIRRDQLGNELEIRVPGLLSTALFEDAEGLIWVGSSVGLFQLSRGAAHGVSGSDGYVRSVLQTDDDAIWIGSSEGLRRLRAGVMKDISLQPYGNSTLSLAHSSRRNAVWVGTYNQGVVEVDADGSVLRQVPVMHNGAPSLVRSVLEARDGTLWIGSGWHGLFQYRDGKVRYLGDKNGVHGYSVQVLFEDTQGNIWGGTSEGMFRRDTDGSVRYWASGKDLPAQSVYDFHEDPDGTLWIASDRGLLRLRDGNFVVYDHALGLPRDKLFRVIADDRGYFWLASNRGVFRVDRAELQQADSGQRTQLSVVVVDHTDGMPGVQGNGGTWPAGWRTRAGNLLFPTAEGLGLIEPGSVGRVRATSVPVVIQQAAVDGVVQEEIAGGLHIAGDGHRLRLQYSGIDFRAPARVRYRYRMTGFDQQWIEAGDSTEAIYTNLPAGEHTFELQAMRLPLDWSDSARVGSTQLKVTVTPPWWKHWASIAGAVVLGGGTLALMWWMRLAHYRRRQLQLSRIIAERTHELTQKNLELEASARERDELMQRLAHQASHDSLTGLPNRRAADRHLEEALERAQATHKSLCVALLDLDHFKAINDSYGHQAGDQVLRRVGARLRSISGVEVFSSRHGGEEFLLVLEGLDEQEARSELDTLRADIAADSLTLDDGRLVRYSVSIGMAVHSAELYTLRQLLGSADRNLYLAKGQGRNRVIG